jgi:hypothetical protein
MIVAVLSLIGAAYVGLLALLAIGMLIWTISGGPL